MNKGIAFILSFTLLFQSFNFDYSDIEKLPILVQHLSSHIDEGDTFNAFISMHYGVATQSHERDHKEHGELPFKHEHLDTHFQLVFLLSGHQYPLDGIDNNHNTNNFNYKEPLTSLVVLNFFQPPKLA